MQQKSKSLILSSIAALITCALLVTVAGLIIFFLTGEIPPLWSLPAGEILFGIFLYSIFGLVIGLPTVAITVISALLLGQGDVPAKTSHVNLAGGAAGFVVTSGLLLMAWKPIGGVDGGIFWLCIESMFAGAIPGLVAAYVYSRTFRRSMGTYDQYER